VTDVEKSLMESELDETVLKMEPVPEAGRQARPDRMKKKAKVMEVIQRHGSAVPSKVHEKVYIDDSELGEILTQMLRGGEIEYVKPSQGKVALRLTPRGVSVYERVKGLLYQSRA
jgi:hypothetical protein